MRILITAGATRERLDDVRFLSNISTGRTGTALADELVARGHAVTLLRGAGAAGPDAVPDVETFSSAADLRARLARRLGAGDVAVVIMAAAVADYRPEPTVEGKLASEADELVVRLIRNPKILPQLRSFSPQPLVVVGFKLTVGADRAARQSAVAAQFAQGGVDATVHNDLAEIRAAAVHPFRFWTDLKSEPVPLAGVAALAAELDVFVRARCRD